MINQTISRRLTSNTIRGDVQAYRGLPAIANYQSLRPEATAEGLQQAYDKMITCQEILATQEAYRKTLLNDVRIAEWEFHSAVLAMKEAVRGQFGVNSNESQAVGLRKKSSYKRATRTKKA